MHAMKAVNCKLEDCHEDVYVCKQKMLVPSYITRSPSGSRSADHDLKYVVSYDNSRSNRSGFYDILK